MRLRRRWGWCCWCYCDVLFTLEWDTAGWALLVGLYHNHQVAVRPDVGEVPSHHTGHAIRAQEPNAENRRGEEQHRQEMISMYLVLVKIVLFLFSPTLEDLAYQRS